MEPAVIDEVVKFTVENGQTADGLVITTVGVGLTVTVTATLSLSQPIELIFLWLTHLVIVPDWLPVSTVGVTVVEDVVVSLSYHNKVFPEVGVAINDISPLLAQIV